MPLETKVRLCIQQEFSVDIDLRQTFTNHRLRFNLSEADVPVYIPFSDVEKFWLPDIYVPNEKNPAPHLEAASSRSFRIYPDGTVRYVSR